MRALVLGVLIFTAAQSFAQDVTIVPKLRAGDAFQLEVIQTSQHSHRPKENGRERNLVDVRVVSAGPAGFVVDWVPGDPIYDNAHHAKEPQLDGVVAQALQDIRFRLKLNPKGELAGMVNRAEVVAKLKPVIETIMRELSARFPDEKGKRFLDLVGRMLTIDTLIASATQDADTYFALYGMSLVPGKSVEVDVEQPHPLGGEPLPARVEVHMDSATEDSASLMTTTTYKAESMKQLMEAVLREAGLTIPPEQLAKLPPIQMLDQGRYIYDRKAGLMREVIVNRRVTTGPFRQIDGYLIKLIKAPR